MNISDFYSILNHFFSTGDTGVLPASATGMVQYHSQLLGDGNCYEDSAASSSFRNDIIKFGLNQEQQKFEVLDHLGEAKRGYWSVRDTEKDTIVVIFVELGETNIRRYMDFVNKAN